MEDKKLVTQTKIFCRFDLLRGEKIKGNLKMNKEIITIVAFLIFFAVPFVSGFNASTNSYFIDSYHTGISGSESNTTSYTFRDTMTYQQGGDASAVMTSYTFNVGWFNISVGVISTDTSPVANDSDDSSTSSGTGGSNCISNFNHDWECGEWSNCINGIQTRTCKEYDNCGNSLNRPNIIGTCEIESTGEDVSPEQLFDIRMDLEETLLFSASDLEAVVTFFSFGTILTLVNLTYLIFDEDGNETYRETGEITVITQEVLRKTFLDLNLSDGKYTFVLETLYGADVFDAFTQEFEIRKKSISLWILIGGGIIVILITGLTWWLIRRKNKKFRKNKKR